ncbi:MULTISPECIES: sensor histidine kinase [Bacillaceae]|uniref:histidine kinase n=1 Tax=Evansella alkalicola TaxID=745819 RepID=A0ABS6JZ63_9BACI|nr:MULTISPECIES: sensor histidine kinase [Bacillaceae]MBU9723700.1 sensor histidine kinase [Bacillus alkalicola]
MVKIRTKLLVYFTVIVSLTIVLSYIQDQNSKQALDYYESSLDMLFIKNEISQKTKETYNSLYLYVLEPDSRNLAEFHSKKQQLQELKSRLNQIESFDDDPISIKNYENLMLTFLEQTDLTVDLVNDRDVQAYSYHLGEAEKVQDYIHETTLFLIDRELTKFQSLFTLVEKKVNSSNKMGLTISITILTLGIFFALWFSRGITRPIAHLTKAAEEISAGRFTGKDIQISNKDELYFLTKTFNEMKKNINQSVKDIEEKSKLAELLKESELRSLQNQINPHFLFNTLNTISRKAYIEGAEETSELISSVSTLLRYNIENIEKTAVLKDEVEVVKEYFYIQKTRFGEKVEFHQDIDEACLGAPVPRLTLQPIVENAFVHGIDSMKRGGEILLHVFEEGDYVFLKVEDNGVGMDEKTRKSLLQSEHAEDYTAKKRTGHSTGIGLRNVISRLKLIDKRNAVFIESELGRGTIVTLKLVKQMKKGGEAEDESESDAGR